MPFFTQEIMEGLKFDTKEEAIKFFEETLLEESPLGNLYDDLHNHDWKGYEIQATGEGNNIAVTLNKPNFKEKIYKRVIYNTYGQEHEEGEFSSEDVIKLIEDYRRAVDITEVQITDSLIEVSENEEGIYFDRNIVLSNAVVNISLDANLTSEVSIQFVIGDMDTDFSIGGTVFLDAEGHVDLKEIDKIIKAMFLNKLEGKLVNDKVFKVGDYPLDYLMEYAQVTDSTIRLEIVSNDEELSEGATENSEELIQDDVQEEEDSSFEEELETE